MTSSMEKPADDGAKFGSPTSVVQQRRFRVPIVVLRAHEISQ
jgi:hypothetical protein